jgi:hypothetical protein
MICVRTFAGTVPILAHDLRTGSNRVAAREAADRALDRGSWSQVQINFNDGSRPMRGDECKGWVERHFPEVIA